MRRQGEKELFSRSGFGDKASMTMIPRTQIGMARMIKADKTMSTRLRATMPTTSETIASATGSKNHHKAKKPAMLIRATMTKRASANHGRN